MYVFGKEKLNCSLLVFDITTNFKTKWMKKMFLSLFFLLDVKEYVEGRFCCFCCLFLGHYFTLTSNFLYRLTFLYTFCWLQPMLRFHAYNYLFKLDNHALTHVAPHRRCSDKLWAKAFSSNALDPLSFCDRRDYRSLWTLNFCERNVGRRTQPAAWKIMKINGNS